MEERKFKHVLAVLCLSLLASSDCSCTVGEIKKEFSASFVAVPENAVRVLHHRHCKSQIFHQPVVLLNTA